MYSISRFSVSVLAGAGLLTVVAIGTAALAAAQPVDQPYVQETDEFFMSQLEATGIPMLPRDEAIDFAHSVCDALAGGNASPDGVAAALGDSTELDDVADARVFVYHSVEAYCPQYIDMVD